MSEPTATSQWWKWAVMPVAAVVGALIGVTVVAVLEWFGTKFWGGYSEDGWYYLYVRPIINAAIFGYIYSILACTVAPTGKVIAGTVMATLLSVIALGFFLWGWTAPNHEIGQSIQITLFSAAVIFGCVAGVVQTHQETVDH